MAATKKSSTSRVVHKKTTTASAKKSRHTTPRSKHTNVESNGIIVFAILSAIFFIIAVIRYL